jgi:signal transduction histidine kinase
LSTILSSVFLLEKYTTTEQQHQREKHIDRIKNSVKNLLIILDDFLSLEKIEEGKVEQKNKIFNLKELSSKLCEEMKDFAKAGQLICYSYEGKEKVILDAVLIKHIMNNLISNAIKYSHDDGRIDICISVNESHITITIRDSGIGISREDQKHLFERFFRASNTAGIQGTGLGLHIVKHYVDMLNGTIRLDSEIGKGSEFVVELSEKTY